MGDSVYVRTNHQTQIMRQNLNEFLTFRTIHNILLYFWSFWASTCMMISFNGNSGFFSLGFFPKGVALYFIFYETERQ